LRDFLKQIYSVYSAIRDAKAVKIWIDLLKGLRSYGGFKLRELGSPKFSAPLAAKVYIGLRLFQMCNNVLEVLYHHAKFREARTARGVEDAKNVQLFFTGNIARSAKRRYISYSTGDFEVFRPQGRYVAPMGMKFGTEE